jgi:hypothetical protein
MRSFCTTFALVVLAAGCSSTWSPANKQGVPHFPTDTDTCASRTKQGAARADSVPKPPVLRVGVSDPDTQLILPWFLADIINAVNTHQSVSDLLHTMKGDF